MQVKRRTTFLSENNRGILQIALELARDKFCENAATLRKESNPALVLAYSRLAETFTDQAAAAAELLTLITLADEVTVINQEEE